MQIKDVMTREVRLAKPEQTIREAAQIMADTDSGVVPVNENDRLVGVITDRDIAIRAVAKNLGPDTPLRQVMTQQVLYCFDDEDVEHVLRNMGENQVRRLPVVNREKRLVGIVSIGDLAKRAQPRSAGEAIKDISQSGGTHSQTTH